jgi:hypothetical protein
MEPLPLVRRPVLFQPDNLFGGFYSGQIIAAGRNAKRACEQYQKTAELHTKSSLTRLLLICADYTERQRLKTTKLFRERNRSGGRFFASALVFSRCCACPRQWR